MINILELLANNTLKFGRGNEQKYPNVILGAHFSLLDNELPGARGPYSLLSGGGGAFSLNFSKMSSYY